MKTREKDTLQTVLKNLKFRVTRLGEFSIESKKVRDILEDTLERYRAILDAFDGYIYICSHDYRVEYMNHKFIERTGYDATGEPCYRALHDLDSRCAWCVNDRVFSGERVVWEMQSPKDGKWFSVVNTPIHNSDGTISKMAVVYDVTEQKRGEETLRERKEVLKKEVDEKTNGLIEANRALKESEEKYRLLVENSLAGVYIIQNGVFKYVNRRFAEMMGYPPEELLGGVDPLTFIHPDDRDMVRDNLKKRFSGGDDTQESILRGVRKDGKLIHLKILGCAGEYRGKPAVFGTCIVIHQEI